MAPPRTPELGRVHVRVTGRVQGVGFRAYVVDQFERLELKGWVRNVGYDQVEAVAEGRRELLEQFAARVIQGPPASRVNESQVDWETASGEFQGIKVRSSQ